MSFEPKYATLADLYQSSIDAFGPRELFGTKKNGRWTWTTYAEFGNLVNKFRGGLASLGIGRGDNIACVANNRVEWAVAAYAAYGLGAAFVPMYEAQHPKEWEFIVRDCEAKLLIVANEGILAKAKGMLGPCPSLKHMVLLDGQSNGDGRITTYQALLDSGKKADAIKPQPADEATLIYTSGTTGNPKGVILTHANIASNVSALHEIVPIERMDRTCRSFPGLTPSGRPSSCTRSSRTAPRSRSARASTRSSTTWPRCTPRCSSACRASSTRSTRRCRASSPPSPSPSRSS